LYRGQSVNIVLKVPQGKSITFGNGIEKILRRTSQNQPLFEAGPENETFVMKGSMLSCSSCAFEPIDSDFVASEDMIYSYKDIDVLDVDGPIIVLVNKHTSDQLEFSENIDINALEITHRDGTLQIVYNKPAPKELTAANKFKFNSKAYDRLPVAMFKSKDLEKIQLNRNAFVKVNDIRADRLKAFLLDDSYFEANLNCTSTTINAKGNSFVNLDGFSEALKLVATGEVEIDTRKLTSSEISVKAEGKHDIKVKLSGLLDVEAEGPTNLTYTGNGIIKTELGAEATVNKIE